MSHYNDAGFDYPPGSWDTPQPNEGNSFLPHVPETQRAIMQDDFRQNPGVAMQTLDTETSFVSAGNTYPQQLSGYDPASHPFAPVCSYNDQMRISAQYGGPVESLSNHYRHPSYSGKDSFVQDVPQHNYYADFNQNPSLGHEGDNESEMYSFDDSRRFHKHHMGMGTHASHGAALGIFGLPVTPGVQPSFSSSLLRISENVASATRDSFTVRDATGNMLYKIQGSFTVNERKTLRDMNNRALLYIEESRLQMREKITIADCNKRPLLCIKEGGVLVFGSRRATGFLGARPSGVPAVLITRNQGVSQIRISSGRGEEMASVLRRRHSIQHQVTGQDTYEVTIAPGVDSALVSMIVVAIDEVWAD